MSYDIFLMIIICALSSLLLLWYLGLIKFDKLRQIFKNRESNYFEQNFTFIREIGKGGYGEVLEVKSIDKRSYAIKKTFIKIKTGQSLSEYEDRLKKEIEILAEMESDFIVQYKTSWIQKELIDVNKRNKFSSSSSKSETYDYKDFRLLPMLYIQFELCQLTLKQAMDEMNRTLNQNESNDISLIGAFISLQLFIQILKGVKYLHSRNPAIIHRDLNPKNILIKNYGKNGNFIKISDFGSATYHEFDLNDETSNEIENKSKIHTRAKGTRGYMAPEVYRSNTYTTKSDIFSIAVIMKELFFIKCESKYKNKAFNTDIYSNSTDFDSDSYNSDIDSEGTQQFSLEEFKLFTIKIYKELIKYRTDCDTLLDLRFDDDIIEFNEIKNENLVQQLCYKFGEENYRPKINEEFTNYFLWNYILTHFISKEDFERNPNIITNFINDSKVKYRLNGINNSKEIISQIYNDIYFNTKDMSEDIRIENLRKIVSHNNNINWQTFILFGDILNWTNSDYIWINIRPNKCVLFCYMLEDDKNDIFHDSFIYCDENYNKYKGKVFYIIENVLNNFEIDFEEKEIEINTQLNNLFESEQVFCYLTKYLLFSENYDYIKIAMNMDEYDILISTEKIEKYHLKQNSGENKVFISSTQIEEFRPLDENWFQNNLIPENDRYVLEKVFEQNYLLHTDCCVKLIDKENQICFVVQKFTIYNDITCNEYALKFDDRLIKLSLKWSNKKQKKTIKNVHD